jgi:hypothetical protein
MISLLNLVFRQHNKYATSTLVFFALIAQVQAQNFFEPADSINKNRVIAAHATAGTLYSASMIGLYQIWYKNQEALGFQFFDDSRDWLQMDKFGHTYSAYWLQNRTFALYRWSGMSQKKALLWSSGFSVLYMNTFEIMDGFSQDYGFSVADVAANTLGIGLFTAQQALWNDQYLSLKFSYSHSPYAQYRPNTLGSTTPERLLKDYNGQTYWFNLNLGKLSPENWKIPDWLCLSFGYSISEKLKSDNPFYTVEFNNQMLEFNAYRRYFFSLDIDLSKLPVKKPWLKSLLANVNMIKIPLPTLELNSRNGAKFYGVYF